MTYTPHPLRIQRRRTKGYKMPPGVVYCGRPTIWGNPFVGRGAVDAYRRWIETGERVLFGASSEGDNVECTWLDSPKSSEINAMAHTLRGKQLACWCPLDKPCHVDVLCELANRDPNQ